MIIETFLKGLYLFLLVSGKGDLLLFGVGDLLLWSNCDLLIYGQTLIARSLNIVEMFTLSVFKRVALIKMCWLVASTDRLLSLSHGELVGETKDNLVI